MAARTLSGASSLRVTTIYAGALVAISVTLSALGPHARAVAVRAMSTNLDNLARGRVDTLVGSAFVTISGAVYLWLPGLLCLLALGELIWGSGGVVVAFAVGHVGATLTVAGGLFAGVAAGWLPVSVERVSDVGISYGTVSVVGALTASIPLRWRPAWIGWWLGVAALAVVGADFTAVGHALALLLGMGVSVRLRSMERWTPIRVVLLAVGMGVGYRELSGLGHCGLLRALVMAPLAGLAGVLFAILIAELPWLRSCGSPVPSIHRRCGQSNSDSAEEVAACE